MNPEMLRVDLNCDMGESFGAWRMGDDDALLQHVSSANIACGFHAGDPSVMKQVVQAAAARGVAIGAHPGFPDLSGFGRRNMDIAPDAVYDMVAYQVGALIGIARTAGVPVAHVKAHGALYNMATRDAALASALAQAVHDVDRALIFFGLPGSLLISEAERLGLRVANEVFADRSYESDGSLTSRSIPGALIADPEMAAHRGVGMVLDGVVEARDGTRVQVRADTICIHGDGAHAAQTAQLLRQGLEEAGVRILPPGTA
jgi:UPF0271 protein